MITCYTGTPGGGKSYAVVLLMIDMLKKGRTIYTNMDGLDEEGCRMALALVSGLEMSVFDQRCFHMTRAETLTFWDKVPSGCVVIIDEVHKLWSSRTYASEGNKMMAEWCSTHRHQGYDAVLITQALDKLDGHVRSLIEWTHRCRKVNFVGSLVKRSYLEYVYSEDDERNCLSRKRKTYDPVIFKCYRSYAAKDIKEKGIGKSTNILRHPVFYAIPVVFVLMLVMLFRSGMAHGDLFGAKKPQKDGMQVFQKAAASVPASGVVDLNKGEGYFKDGKWVSAPVPVEVKKGVAAGAVGPSEPSSTGGAAVMGVKGAYVYEPPAKVVKDGNTWSFIEQGSGRTIGFVKFVSE